MKKSLLALALLSACGVSQAEPIVIELEVKTNDKCPVMIRESESSFYRYDLCKVTSFYYNSNNSMFTFTFDNSYSKQFYDTGEFPKIIEYFNLDPEEYVY